MSEAYMGEIRIMGFGYAPRGWAKCDGSLLKVSDFSALYSLIGTTYGGDGHSTMGLPNLCGRTVVHQGYGYPIGALGGQETVALNADQVGEHSHTVQCSANMANYHKPKDRFFGNSNQYIYNQNPGGATLHPQSMANQGDGEGHDNMQPSTVLNFCIALDGAYPSRS